MTDIALDSTNDLLIRDGQLVLIDRIEELIRQRLVIKLRTFTGTWFTDINFGLDTNLIFRRGTQELLDQHIKTLISETEGVLSLVSFSSVVGIDRKYNCTFQYKIETGEIIGIRGLVIGGGNGNSDSGGISDAVWKNGYWDFGGIWDSDQIWGG